eukprot:TRINITY_DN31215_c0_g1_i1.p1 TRINITY_DN31215_c0_g1~~TRINITY_DN31215_c0_g1_i1.p1  ORF type:complete len:235 (+),score=87.82 TRINITY_DN31215_c0_g1_i1:208-912(+)
MASMEEVPQLDEETMATLKIIHKELELEDAVEEDINWEDIKPMPVDPVELILERVNSWKDRIYKKFKKSKAAVQEIVPENKSGCELTGELEEAWNLYTRGGEQIPSRAVGYVLRILGQNPTEDEIVEMVMKANCDWEGVMSRKDFIGVGIEILKSSCDQMDDVKSAFRVFDHNNDGTISKEELKEAMVNFGTRVTDDEFQTMFAEADQNNDGLIDFDEFVMMMMPSTTGGGGIM